MDICWSQRCTGRRHEHEVWNAAVLQTRVNAGTGGAAGWRRDYGRTGVEGGSYGDLTQGSRSREHAGDAASESHGIRWLALVALLALAIRGLLRVAMIFWFLEPSV